jgi:hypothetical protein
MINVKICFANTVMIAMLRLLFSLLPSGTASRFPFLAKAAIAQAILLGLDTSFPEY